MNFATRALLPLLSISVNDADPADGSGGGDGGTADDGKGGADGGEQADGKKAADASAGDGKGADAEAAKKAAADTAAKDAATKATAELTKSYESWKPTLPKDMPFDEKGFGDFRKTFIGLGLKPEQSQKLVDAFANAELGRLKAVAEGLQAEQVKLDKAVRADKELAGEDGKLLEQTAALARKAMNKFATPELRALLNDSRLATHPEMLRLMSRVGKGLAEDKTDGAREGGGKREPTAKDRNRARYDHPTSAELHTSSDS